MRCMINYSNSKYYIFPVGGKKREEKGLIKKEIFLFPNYGEKIDNY